MRMRYGTVKLLNIAKEMPGQRPGKIYLKYFDDKPIAEKNNIGKYNKHKLYL